ncbi:MAG: diacylglycerol kinase family lipid kinase [Oscillospiraceae bacterium]|nr:diacylglycerol kinase family lipid kinase [Oscillospiraceae bacterium]MCL2126413.1 diacylglycerol kinase family lipid kinase [Oscillospiraceae bacterium]
MKHLFIINPVAGNKKRNLGEIEAKIAQFADELGDPYEIYFTKAPMDAAEKVAETADAIGDGDLLYVYACGGDGTLNECVNGAAERANTAITHYPCGTGNDFIRTFGEDNVAKFHDLHAFIKGTVKPLDLIDCNGRYGINICSVGIDARVANDVHKYSKVPVIGGATGYVTSLAVNIIKGIKQKYRISIDGEIIEKDITLVCACNGRFYGGGFNPVPDALPDDGVLEYLILDGVSRLRVAQITNRYAKGRFRELSKIIDYHRSDCMEIEGERDFVVNIDGEIISTNKICFNIVPNGINFLFPSGMVFSDVIDNGR